MGENCEKFREYLHSSGAIDALNNAIVKLYDLPHNQRPDEPLKFLSENLFPNGKKDTNITDSTTKKLADAQAAIQVLKNVIDLEANVDKSIEKAIAKLQADDSCTSLLKKNLKNKDEYDKLASSSFLQKSKHPQLFDCVKIGLVDHKQDIGLIAADRDCYSTFASLFDPIIKEIHGEMPVSPLKPSWEYKVSELEDPDPQHEFIQRAVITCRRSLQNQSSFQVKMSEKDFSDVLETIIANLGDKFGADDLKNLTYKFVDLDDNKKAELLEQKLIFDKSEFDEALEFVGATKYWPVGRAAYIAENKSYVIWVNRIDHLEFKSFDNDVLKAMERISVIGKIIDENMKPLSSDKYGWLTSSPKYIGNAMTVSVFIKLTKLSGKLLDEILDKYKLIINSTECADKGCTIYEIQNKSSLCIQLETMVNILAGIAAIIKSEKEN